MAQDVGLRFAMVNPLEYRAAILDLFAADGTDRFAGHFDRVFPAEVEAGLESCVGFEPGGRMVLHISRFINRHRFDGNPLTAGVTGHLIAERSYRTLKPAVMLVRHLIEEERRRGTLDFLYTTTGPRTVPVLKLAGFAELGSAARFVKLVGGASLVRRSAARIHNAFVSVRVDRSREVAIAPVASLGAALDELLGGDHPPEKGLVPVATRHQLARWFPHFPGDDDLIVHDAPFSPRGAYLMLHVDAASHMADITSVNAAGMSALPRLAAAVFETLRHRGVWGLALTAPRESALAQAGKRAGFFERPDATAIMGTGISPAGIAATGAVRQWRLCATDFDGAAA